MRSPNFTVSKVYAYTPSLVTAVLTMEMSLSAGLTAVNDVTFPFSIPVRADTAGGLCPCEFLELCRCVKEFH